MSVCGFVFHLLSIASPLQAQDWPQARATLEGVQRVMVAAGFSTGADFTPAVYNNEMMSTDVQLRLRESGIVVLEGPTAAAEADGMVAVTVDVLPVPEVGGIIFYNIRVRFLQLVLLARSPQSRAFATTWEDRHSGYMGENLFNAEISDVVTQQVERFLNAYLAANQGGN